MSTLLGSTCAWREETLSKYEKNGIQTNCNLSTVFAEFIWCHFQNISILNEPHVYFEEDSWVDPAKRTLRLCSQNLTWTQIAEMKERSFYQPHKENPMW